MAVGKMQTQVSSASLTENFPFTHTQRYAYQVLILERRMATIIPREQVFNIRKWKTKLFH